MDKQRFQPLTSAAVVALALPAFTLGQSSHVNAATTPAVTAVKTSYNAKTKSLTIAGKAKGASKVVVSYNAKALKPVKVTKKGKFKTAVKFTGYKDFTLTGLNAKGKAVTKAYVLTKDNYAAAKPTLLKADRTKKGNFKVVASTAGKKSSQAAQFKIIGVGQATVTNY